MLQMKIEKATLQKQPSPEMWVNGNRLGDVSYSLVSEIKLDQTVKDIHIAQFI